METRTSKGILVSTMVILALMSIQPTPVGAAPVAYSCTNHADHTGMGGTQISCDTAECDEGNVLGVEITAFDADADVYADFNCGGQAAPCGPNPVTCVGASPGVTRRAQSPEEGASCRGSTNEAWDSAVSIACLALGAPFGADDNPIEEVHEAVCDAYPQFPSCRQPPSDPAPENPEPESPPLPGAPGIPSPSLPEPGLSGLRERVADTCAKASAAFAALTPEYQLAMLPTAINSGALQHMTTLLYQPDAKLLGMLVSFDDPLEPTCQEIA